MAEFFTAAGLISLLTLTAMEVVLGVDNVVFLAILAGKLPAAQQPLARRLGLALALVIRVGLLFAISWLATLTSEFFRIKIGTFDQGFSGRDLIMLAGGLFLVAKATHEIYEKLEIHHAEKEEKASRGAFGLVLFQILLMDVIFSLDSVITAVGMANHIPIMVVAMVLSMVFMLFFAGRISDFVNNHPSMKILALSFLILIGVMLTAEGWGAHVSKGYVYFAMAFSLGVELINMRFRKKHRPVALHTALEGREKTTKVSI